MAIYRLKALTNIQCMKQGSRPWNRYENDLWHWFKHARSVFMPGIHIPAEIPNLNSEHEYLNLARAICKMAAEGYPGTEVSIQELNRYEAMYTDILVWFQPPGRSRGLFIVVKDCGSYGELVTMYPPIDGRLHYEEKRKEIIH